MFAGLYIHIPFCLKKCIYCDFYSETDLSHKKRFIHALLREMEMISPLPFCFDTIYIGGGTPSIFEPTEINQILKAAKNSFTFQTAPETTIEANPGTIDIDRLKAYRAAGINRISIGVQTFQDNNLELLGRIHTSKQADAAINAAKAAGFESIGLDLIFGIPEQKPASWLQDLERATSYDPDHFSCYQLTLEPGTPMDHYRKKGQLSLLGEEKIVHLMEMTIAYLTAHGYVQYEISNFAKSSDMISRHNVKYWSFVPYIGLGPSAHSYIPPKRYWNHSDIIRYVGEINNGRSPVDGEEVLDKHQQITEAIYLGIRTTAGIDIDAFNKRFQVDFSDMFRKTIEEFTEDGFINISENRCHLTPKGMLYLDSVAAMFGTV